MPTGSSTGQRGLAVVKVSEFSKLMENVPTVSDLLKCNTKLIFYAWQITVKICDLQLTGVF